MTYGSSGEEISDPEILEAISKELEQELNTPLGYDIEQQNIMFEENKSIIKTSFDNSIKGLQKDPTYKILVQLKEKLQKDSPIHKLLKKVAISLGDTFGDIEETLDAIYTQYDNAPEAADFVLNDEQIKVIIDNMEYQMMRKSDDIDKFLLKHIGLISNENFLDKIYDRFNDSYSFECNNCILDMPYKYAYKWLTTHGNKAKQFLDKYPEHFTQEQRREIITKIFDLFII